MCACEVVATALLEREALTGAEVRAIMFPAPAPPTDDEVRALLHPMPPAEG